MRCCKGSNGFFFKKEIHSKSTFNINFYFFPLFENMGEL